MINFEHLCQLLDKYNDIQAYILCVSISTKFWWKFKAQQDWWHSFKYVYEKHFNYLHILTIGKNIWD